MTCVGVHGSDEGGSLRGEGLGLAGTAVAAACFWPAKSKNGDLGLAGAASAARRASSELLAEAAESFWALRAWAALTSVSDRSFSFRPTRGALKGALPRWAFEDRGPLGSRSMTSWASGTDSSSL